MLDASRCPHFNIKNLSRTFWNFYSFNHCDPQLFSLLCQLLGGNQRTLSSLQRDHKAKKKPKTRE